MSQRSIRFPDEVAEAIGRECAELDRTFTWWVVNACRSELRRGQRGVIVGDPPQKPEETRYAHARARPSRRSVARAPVSTPSVPDDVSGREEYVEGALGQVETTSQAMPPVWPGCPECSGDMKERDPLSRIRICVDCGYTVRP